MSHALMSLSLIHILFADLIHAADHAELETAAGGRIRNTFVEPHEIHCPSSDIHEQHGRLIPQQLRMNSQSRIALWKQLHKMCIRDSARTAGKSRGRYAGHTQKILYQPCRLLYPRDDAASPVLNLFARVGISSDAGDSIDSYPTNGKSLCSFVTAVFTVWRYSCGGSRGKINLKNGRCQWQQAGRRRKNGSFLHTLSLIHICTGFPP